MKAIVAFSFGGGAHGPGPANERLAKVVFDTWVLCVPAALVVVQDYLADCFAEEQIRLALVVRKHTWRTRFLDTGEVARQAGAFLRAQDVKSVLLVAHPFLHWVKCKWCLEAEGFEVSRVKTGWVPFDKRCVNWWVRSPLHLLWYAALRKMTGRSGY